MKAGEASVHVRGGPAPQVDVIVLVLPRPHRPTSYNWWQCPGRRNGSLIQRPLGDVGLPVPGLAKVNGDEVVVFRP